MQFPYCCFELLSNWFHWEVAFPSKTGEKKNNKHPLCLFFQYFEELYADDPKKYQSYRISLYKRMIVCKTTELANCLSLLLALCNWRARCCCRSPSTCTKPVSPHGCALGVTLSASCVCGHVQFVINTTYSVMEAKCEMNPSCSVHHFPHFHSLKWRVKIYICRHVLFLQPA